jgi:hypothetical protein
MKFYTASGTWNWADAGSPSTVFVIVQAGAGGGMHCGTNYQGGGGGCSYGTISVSGNISYTVGSGGAGYSVPANGGSSTFSTKTAGGGAKAGCNFNGAGGSGDIPGIPGATEGNGSSGAGYNGDGGGFLRSLGQNTSYLGYGAGSDGCIFVFW